MDFQGTFDRLLNVLQIDRMALDTELERQPQIYTDINDFYVEVVKARDLCKEENVAAEAKLYAALQKSTTEKLSDAKLLRMMAEDPQHLADAKELIALDFWVGRARGLLEAASQRSSSLRRLADLAVTGYYATTTSAPEPRISRPAPSRVSLSK